jgi:hypothetical protein
LSHGSRVLLIDVERSDLHIEEGGLDIGVNPKNETAS